MATTFSKGLVQLRGNTAANMASSNPVLLAREQAVETDTGRTKIGDGVTTWNSLPYVDQQVNFTPTGSVLPFAGASSPSSLWLLCDGSAVSRTTYASLFAVISDTYGAGDGSTTFNLPDMRAATPVGAGTSTQFTENETKTLGTAYDDQMQGHDILGGVPMPNGLSNHTIYGVSSQGTPGLATFRMAGNSSSGPFEQARSSGIISDGSNGTPRTGATTHGKQVAVNYIIRI